MGDILFEAMWSRGMLWCIVRQVKAEIEALEERRRSFITKIEWNSSIYAY